MKQYLNLLDDVRVNGEFALDRTGTGTYSLFGKRLEFDLRKGFPLVTTKKIHWKSVVYELLWFLSGDTNTKFLKDHGVSIWDEWALDNGDLGPIYGKQWRSWESVNWSLGERTHIDQLFNCIRQIKENPHSRRIIVNAWNVGQLPLEHLSPQENVIYGRMALAPCHMMFQFYVSPCENYLDLQMYQRSVDTFLGLPFNLASYSLLLMMVAQVTGKKPRNFIWIGGDTHLYKNHVEQAIEQCSRKPFNLPTVKLNPLVNNIDSFTFEDIILENYEYHPHIKAEISV